MSETVIVMLWLYRNWRRDMRHVGVMYGRDSIDGFSKSGLPMPASIWK